MRFGGHETFPVRDGWLAKGLRLLAADPAGLDAKDVADRLGVGRNMAKSIRHWLVVTGLAHRPSRKQYMELTGLGHAVRQHDPFMLDALTWWCLHSNLVIRQDAAITWSYLFNAFPHDRFDRMTFLDHLARYATAHESRPPSRDTLNRDALCLLATYGRQVPPTNEDPEEGRDSPFRELGLLTHFVESDTYQINRARKPIPSTALAYAMALGHGTREGFEAEEALSSMLARPGGAGHVFALDGESLTELVDQAEDDLAGEFTTRLLGSERWVHLSDRQPHEWYTMNFERGSAA